MNHTEDFAAAAATRVPTTEHRVHRDDVDSNALSVTSTLTEAGFQAFLVGGCVRDLLLGATPKDFDVATNATPEQVRSLFRRSRLVGRRFRIAHVRFGRNEMVEVSTFRGSTPSDEPHEQRHSDDGLLLRDNVYGTLEEDAFRRDFTVNALYYDPDTEEVLDFVGGMEDLAERTLRCIGDPAQRLREDPVRLLRAIRFQAKLGFKLDSNIQAELADTADRLGAIPPARLFDEFSKLFLSGYAESAWSIIDSTPIRAALFPCTAPEDEFVHRAMANTDARINEGKPVTPGFLLAVLLWQDYLARFAEQLQHKKPAEARANAAAMTLSDQQQIISVPRRFSHFVRDVWGLQHRLEDRYARSIRRLLEHARFRAAYDFLVLRAESGEGANIDEAADWWTRFQDADEDTQQQLIDGRTAAQPQRPRRRRKRRSRKKPSA